MAWSDKSGGMTATRTNAPRASSSAIGRLLRVSLIAIVCALCSTVTAVDEDAPRRLRGGGSSSSSSSRPLRILTLGGSVTWGAALPSRQWAYPYLIGSLGSHSVHNLAIRASDAFFPSLCVQSMIAEARLADVDFDVIVLEYSINGFNGITTLIKRLQYRYPDAVFVYVHLVSLKMVATRSVESSGDETAVPSWEWKKGPNARTELFHPKPKFRELLDRVGAYLYELPRRSDAEWLIESASFFAEDGHHLSERGHMRVARDLLALLDAADLGRPPSSTTTTRSVPERHQKLLRTWGEGDACSDWLLTARLSNPYVLRVEVGTSSADDERDGAAAEEEEEVYAPVVRQMISRKGNPTGKYSLEFAEAGTIVVRNPREHPVAVFVSYMSGSVGEPGDPRRYPLTMVTLNDADAPIAIDPSAPTDVDGRINPNHVRETTEIGVARPGDNVIRIEPVRRRPSDDKEDEERLPFRLVAVALYGFKYNVGLPLLKARNTLVVDDDKEKKDGKI